MWWRQFTHFFEFVADTRHFQSPRLDKDVKVTILGCFGDIALAIGEHFERYIQIVMSMLIEASTAAVVTNPVSLPYYFRYSYLLIDLDQ